jgi:hypothetical protein
MKTGTRLAFLLLVVVALAHLVRLFLGWEVIVAGYIVPAWMSAIGFAVAGGLAFLIYKEHRA